MRSKTDLKIGKEIIYAFLMVVLLVFGLFFLNYHFDISASAFTVKAAESPGGSDFFDNLDGKLKDLTDEASETFKNSIYP